METIKLGISTCLLGENVRYDGGHKHDRFLTDTLGKYVTYRPVCPEMECGLGVPRESMRLVDDPESPRLVTVRTRQDHTERMALEKENLCGFIFKSDSPSSGMERVKVYKDGGMPQKNGVGVFARIFMEHFPLLPVEEEGRLHDPLIRENFIERIFTLKRWVESVETGKSRARLVDFHTRHKMLIIAHSEKHERIMGRMVAQGGNRLSLDGNYAQYQTLLMEALRLKATPKKNANVLQHMMGYFKQQLSTDEKMELIEIIDKYRMESLPLIVPVTLIGHYVRKYDQPYLKMQDLQMRNHV
jgi:uncharacterized protein YbgA (DUF1722 family)/uncharacterized protein YbbK (DUF523 family)